MQCSRRYEYFFIGDEKTRCASDCYFTDKYTKDLKDSLGQLWEKGTVRVAWQIGLSITIRTTLGLKVPIVLAPAGRPIGRVGEKKGFGLVGKFSMATGIGNNVVGSR